MGLPSQRGGRAGDGWLGDTVPRPLDECGPDTDWGELHELRTTTVLSPSMVDELRRLDAARWPESGSARSRRLLPAPARIHAADHRGRRLGLADHPAPATAPVPRAGRLAARAAVRPVGRAWWPASRRPSRPAAGDAQRRRTLPPCHYPLAGLLWSLALLGPRNGLLRALAEGERYCAIDRGDDSVRRACPAHLGSALARLLVAPPPSKPSAAGQGLDAVRAAAHCSTACTSKAASSPRPARSIAAPRNLPGATPSRAAGRHTRRFAARGQRLRHWLSH